VVIQEQIGTLAGIPDVLGRIEDHRLGLAAKNMPKQGALSHLAGSRNHDYRESASQQF
jgi:hypothetical protein